MQAAVVVLNKRGWVGYLLPHATEAKLYCHYHRQEHMDGESQEDFETQQRMHPVVALCRRACLNLHGTGVNLHLPAIVSVVTSTVSFSFRKSSWRE